MLLPGLPDLQTDFGRILLEVDQLMFECADDVRKARERLT